jgi:hypothetical protein
MRLWLGLLLFGCNERAPALLPETDQKPAAIAADRASPLADGSVVVSRRGDAPGESDLFIVPRAGEPRVLAPAPGADDMPLVLADGRVAFVSTRSTIASIWIADPLRGEATQLTNVGLVAGKKREGFVPPPMQSMTAVGNELRYESAPGVHWAVDLTSGAARRVEADR